MTPTRAASLLLLEAVARDATPTELRSLHPGAARHFERGDLAASLVALGLDAELARACARWPRAGLPGLRRLEALPTGVAFVAQLTQVLAYFVLVAVLQSLVLAVLRAKVLPVLDGVAGDFRNTHGLLDVLSITVSLLCLAALPLGLWLLAGASGWHRLPGWGRELRRAKEAALAAALRETDAPEDARAAVHGTFRILRDPEAGTGELDELFYEAGAAAEAGLERFLAAARLVGLTLASLLALATLVAVYGTMARLPWLG